MADLSILVPEDTINYIDNPSFRYNLDNWNAHGSSLMRVLDHARFGIASLRVITDNVTRHEGVFYRVNFLTGSGITGMYTPILHHAHHTTASAYVRGTGHVRIRFINGTLGTDWQSKEFVLKEYRWQRIFVTGLYADTDDARVYIETFGDIKQQATFYVDGVQLENKAYPTTYCDGTQPGCRWAGIYDASISYRSAYTREGGRWVMVSGALREQEDIYMTVVSGLGVAPIQNNRQSYAMMPGGFLDNVKILERPITLQFHVKHKTTARTYRQALSLGKLHELRQMLIDIIKPDKTGGNQPFWIEYKDGDIPVYAQVYYNGGLEGEWDIRNQWTMDFQVNLLATSPMFYEDDQDIVELDFNESKYFNGIAGRINGEWDNMNYGTYGNGVDGFINDIEIGKDGEIYICGFIQSLNYDANAIDPNIPAHNCAYYDGFQWHDLAPTGVMFSPPDIINDMAVAPNGDVYVTGKFTSINGVAAVNIARLNIRSHVWHAMGAGLDNDGLNIECAPNGDVYVAGKFHKVGLLNCYHIARWDGSSWHEIGNQGGMNNDVYSLEISKDGSTVYLGGIFTDEYGLSANAMLRIAKYNVLLNDFTPMGSGFNGTVREVVISPSNYVYACGDFTLSGIAPNNYISKWNGSMWEQLGEGLSGGIALSMDIADNGNIVVVGEFDYASGIGINRVALWNGSTWANVDIQLAAGSTPSPTSVIFNGEDIIVGGSYFSEVAFHSRYAGINYVTNDGTAEVSPIIYIKGEVKLRYIENETTKKKVWFDLTILENEEIFIDFGAGKFYSTVRGDLTFSLIPGGDFNAFTLIPGENKIAAFMRNDVSALMYLYYTPTHWGVDATKHKDSY